MKRLKDWFDGLKPEHKRKVMMAFATTCFVLLMLVAYNAKKHNEEPQKKTAVKTKATTMDFTAKDDDLALRLGLKAQLEDLEKRKAEETRQQREEINELKALIEDMKRGGIPKTSEGSETYGDMALSGVPPSPYEREYPEAVKEPAAPTPPVIITGGIASVSVPAPAKPAPPDNASKTKPVKVLKNFIPAGTILKATLLNGMYAPTMQKGESAPYPALMRLWDLGFLPNEVRKDLSGCFVLGEARGELADSRVHVRLNTLSCISRDEKKVLEKQIKGFVSGDDGKIGIFGEIRANFGKLALSALLAEFLAAAGDTVATASKDVIQTPLGGLTSSYPKTGDILASAAGKGFGEAAKMIADFYLDIMKEMSPVIEVSGRRDVEIIIGEGAELELQDFDWRGVKANETKDILDSFK